MQEFNSNLTDRLKAAAHFYDYISIKHELKLFYSQCKLIKGKTV